MRTLRLFVYALLISQPILAQVGDWPVNPTDYTYFGTPSLNQTVSANYALLQWKSNGMTFLNSPLELRFRISNNDHMIVTNAGFVGVGTVAPAALLDVNGKGRYSDNLKIFSTPESWAEGLTVIKPTGWSGIRFARNDPATNNYDGNWAIGYSQATGNDLTISTNYSGNQYDGLLLISNSTRNVGIGTITPQDKLDVAGDIRGASRLKFSSAAAYDGGSYGVIGLQTGVPGKNIVFYNYDGPVYELMTMNGTTGTTAINNGGLTVSGNVGIGTTAPDAKLSVKGQIHAQEVKVDLNGAIAPDYVFDKDYKLPSLEEIQSYITTHKHLPEVPSAKEIEANGLNLGEMNLLLLKKVEELTLYVIELMHEIKEHKESKNNK